METRSFEHPAFPGQPLCLKHQGGAIVDHQPDTRSEAQKAWDEFWLRLEMAAIVATAAIIMADWLH